jgi:hypothetical protein
MGDTRCRGTEEVCRMLDLECLVVEKCCGMLTTRSFQGHGLQ